MIMFPRNVYLHLNCLLEKLFREKQLSIKFILAFGLQVAIMMFPRNTYLHLNSLLERDVSGKNN